MAVYEVKLQDGSIYEIKTTEPSKLMSTLNAYFKEAQPAFKLAVTHPESFTQRGRQQLTPEEIQRVTNLEWPDIYRQAGAPKPGGQGILPFAKSQYTAGQLIPQAVGELLNLGTRPSTYIIAGATPKMAELAATTPMTRRFLQRQTPTLAKALLEKYPVSPVYKETGKVIDLGVYGQYPERVDITKPFSPAPQVTWKSITQRFPRIMGKNYTLDRANEAATLLDDARNLLGDLKGKVIQQVGNRTVDIDKLNAQLPKVIPKQVLTILDDPIYEIRKLPDGSIEPTIVNLDKMKQAIGDLFATDAWQKEAPNQAKAIARQIYGIISQSIKDAAPEAKEPITDYHNFMDIFRQVNKTLRSPMGTILEKRFRGALKPGSERQYQIAWREMQKYIPRLRQIIIDVQKFNQRQTFKAGAKRIAPWLPLIVGGGYMGSKWLGKATEGIFE